MHFTKWATGRHCSCSACGSLVCTCSKDTTLAIIHLYGNYKKNASPHYSTCAACSTESFCIQFLGSGGPLGGVRVAIVAEQPFPLTEQEQFCSYFYQLPPSIILKRALLKPM